VPVRGEDELGTLAGAFNQMADDLERAQHELVEAEKFAQANVIRRREETNATRSLLNTAKVMESNAADSGLFPGSDIVLRHQTRLVFPVGLRFAPDRFPCSPRSNAR